MPPRALHHLLLALLLLLAQQVAAVHVLSHQDQAPLPDHACAACVTAAHLGTGLTSTTPLLEPAAHAVERPPLSESVHARQPRPPFRSRAPPAPL
jgi:hypothetical protein